MNKIGFILGKALGAMVAAISLMLFVCLVKLQLLPAGLLIAIGVLLVLLTAMVLLLTWSGSGKVRMSIGITLAVLLIVFLSVGTNYAWQTLDTINNVIADNTETVHVGIYVRADDTRDFDQNAAGYRYGILHTIDRDTTDGAINQLNEKLKTPVTCVEYQRLPELVDALLESKVDAIIINQSFLSMLEDMPGYAEKMGHIREAVLKEVEDQIEPPVAPTTPTDATSQGGVLVKPTKPIDSPKPKNDAFAVFISGIDTVGKVSVRSRSDVNIIAVVNPQTRQILLISTPRDYYVPLSISGGVPDKLTHAGNFGIKVSMDTLEMLYGMEINYYFRVNFSGFEKIVDALGGVTVQSDYAFTTAQGYKYNKGANTLDGKAALEFCRERYAFITGDHQRGKNQMAMIKGVINKLLSPALLTNYTQVLKAVEDCFEMSVPMDVISDLVSAQLSDGGSWDVVTHSVTGTGGYAVPYSMGYEVWVMHPDYKTVNQAKQMIRDVLDGKIVTP